MAADTAAISTTVAFSFPAPLSAAFSATGALSTTGTLIASGVWISSVAVTVSVAETVSVALLIGGEKKGASRGGEGCAMTACTQSLLISNSLRSTEKLSFGFCAFGGFCDVGFFDFMI